MLNISDNQLLTMAAKCRADGRLKEAEALCRQVLVQTPGPGWAIAHDLLGRVLLERGQAADAVAAFRKGIEYPSICRDVYDLMLMTLHALPESTPESLFREHVEWARRCVPALDGPGAPHTNERSPGKRLRIGYVSQDFRIQPLGVFMLPLMAAHDRANYEITCYSQAVKHDEVTRRLCAAASVWRDIAGFSDQQVARQIRADGIDILVDMSLHSLDNRLQVFAYKPAPVQATFLGYCSTTGLEAIDYRITDPYLDPPGATEPLGETPIRLPQSYWSYEPIIETPQVNALPAAMRGYVTFASLNNLSKVSDVSLGAWCEILRTVPRSRLLIHARERPRSERVDGFLKGQGIDPQRVSYVGYVSVPDYFRLYSEVDIALDSFPWTGGTTTCDALWMGVPVVSQAGQTAVSRGSLSILSNVGVPELVAFTPDRYVQIAVELARDPGRLGQLRATLRQRMAQSPLMDARGYARHLEATYRRMWQAWCAGGTASG